MDDYNKFIHEVAEDIEADRNGWTLLVEGGDSVLRLPGTNDGGLEKWLSDLGIIFEKKFCHTYKIIWCPSELNITDETVIDMAKKLWDIEPGQKWWLPKE